MSDAPAELRAALADRYTIERELGRGGMATVYLARDLKHRRSVALKVLGPSVATSLGADRFLREIELAAGLQHPNIVTVLDSGVVGEAFWFTMPFIEGETLRSRLARERQLPLSDALRLAVDAARALEFAHGKGVLHRDVKPENLLLTADGSTLLADFGVARASGAGEGLTETGIVVGTPAYMSPEQAAGESELDARSDVYSLGCVLYEMLTGEMPFQGSTPQSLLAKRLTATAPGVRTLRDVPVAVEQVVARALARSPADRFGSAGELVRVLEEVRTGAHGFGTGGAASEAARPGESGEDPTAAHVPGARRTGRVSRGTRLGIGIAVVGALAVAAALVVPRWRAAATGELPTSVGVLPFADLSEAHDQEYFSDGLTDELITALSGIGGLRVAARTSSFQFKGQEVDVREVGRRLNVGAVLAGSVRRSGDQLRVSVELVDARDGYQMWASSYDRELADVFAVQEDIARSIISALRVTLATGDDAALRSRPTEDLEAHDLYLKGRFAWNRRTASGMVEAVRYLEESVGRDPDFALAWAALAEAYVLAIPYAGLPRDEVWPKGRAAAERALSLDGTIGQAHTALAYGSMIYDWDWDAAETSFRRAIEADPTYPTAHQWYGDFLWGRGRLDEALAQMLEAERLDPLSLVIGAEVGATYYMMRRPVEAEAKFRELLALDPNHPSAVYRFGLVELVEGRYTEAIGGLERVLELGGFQDDIAGALAYAYAASGDAESAARYTGELEDRLRDGRVGPFALALAYTGQGRLDRAFAYLDRAIDVRDPFMPEDFFDPLLDPLRADSRFARIEERMGLR